jgi:hypothetical protein
MHRSPSNLRFLLALEVESGTDLDTIFEDFGMIPGDDRDEPVHIEEK